MVGVLKRSLLKKIDYVLNLDGNVDKIIQFKLRDAVYYSVILNTGLLCYDICSQQIKVEKEMCPS